MRFLGALFVLGTTLILSTYDASAGGTSGVTINHADEPEAITPQGAVQKVCRGCHDLQIVTDTPKDYDAWHVTVQDMIDRGAVGTLAEFDLVMDYLYKNVTTIDVNHARPEDLGAILGASDSTVQSIVKRRSERPFKNLKDLETVQGLDAPALEAKKRMIFFN